jgi:hypothetical protein
MVWRILQLLLSLGLIIGGLSGDYVLRGTESSGALVIFGIGWLIYDIYQIVTYNKDSSGGYAQLITDKALEKSRPLKESAEIIFTNEGTGQNHYRFLYNNNEFVKGVPPGGSVTITANQSVNVLCAKVEKYDEKQNAFVVDISEGETKKVSYINEQFVLK